MLAPMKEQMEQMKASGAFDVAKNASGALSNFGFGSRRLVDLPNFDMPSGFDIDSLMDGNFDKFIDAAISEMAAEVTKHFPTEN